MSSFLEDYDDYDVEDVIGQNTDIHIKKLQRKAMKEKEKKRKRPDGIQMKLNSYKKTLKDLVSQRDDLESRFEHLSMKFPIQVETCLFLKCPVSKKLNIANTKNNQMDKDAEMQTSNIDDEILRSKQLLSHASIKLTFNIADESYKSQKRSLESIQKQSKSTLKSLHNLVDVTNTSATNSNNFDISAVSNDAKIVCTKFQSFFNNKVCRLIEMLNEYETNDSNLANSDAADYWNENHTFKINKIGLFVSGYKLLERIKYIRSKHCKKSIDANDSNVNELDQNTIRKIQEIDNKTVIRESKIPKIFDPNFGVDINIYNCNEVLHYSNCVLQYMFNTDRKTDRKGSNIKMWDEPICWGISKFNLKKDDEKEEKKQNDSLETESNNKNEQFRYEKLNVANYIFKKWNKFVNIMTYDVAHVICEFAGIEQDCIYCIKTIGTGICGLSFYNICAKFYQFACIETKEKEEWLDNDNDNDKIVNMNDKSKIMAANINNAFVATSIRCDVDTSFFVTSDNFPAKTAVFVNDSADNSMKLKKIVLKRFRLEDDSKRFGKIPSLISYLNRNGKAMQRENHKFDGRGEKAFRKHLKSCLVLLQGDQLYCKCLQQH